MQCEKWRFGYRENVGLERGNRDVVTKFLRLINAAGGRAEDFENHARGVSEKCVARHRHADDHAVRAVKCLIAPDERHIELKIATGGETGAIGEFSPDETGKIPGDAVMVQGSAGHGENATDHVFMRDLRGKFAMEIIFTGNPLVCHCQRHAATVSGSFPTAQVSLRP
jgi:hypothetical protein